MPIYWGFLLLVVCYSVCMYMVCIGKNNVKEEAQKYMNLEISIMGPLLKLTFGILVIESGKRMMHVRCLNIYCDAVMTI